MGITNSAVWSLIKRMWICIPIKAQIKLTKPNYKQPYCKSINTSGKIQIFLPGFCWDAYTVYTIQYIELLAWVQLCKRGRYSLSTAVCYLLLLSLLPLYSYIYCTVCCIIPFQYFLQQCSILHPFHLISTVVIYYSLLSSLCIEFPTACIVSESPLPS